MPAAAVGAPAAVDPAAATRALGTASQQTGAGNDTRQTGTVISATAAGGAAGTGAASAAVQAASTVAATGDSPPADQGAKKPPKWGTSKIADSRIRIQNDGFHGRKVMAGACHARRNSE